MMDLEGFPSREKVGFKARDHSSRRLFDGVSVLKNAENSL